jgi:ELWxxDGT repeat protein
MAGRIAFFDDLHTDGLWVTNGTAAGTFELTGISGAFTGGLLNPLNHPGQPDLTVYNGEVLFAGEDAAENDGLWVSNGTAAGTHELTGISGAYTGAGGIFNPGVDYTPPDFTVFNGEVLFDGLDAGENFGLWVTNGTAVGTHELTGISGLVAPGAFTPFNGEVLFTGGDASNRAGLWVTNGTAAGTFELTGISNASTNGVASVNNTDLTVFNGEVLFTGNDGATTGLWVTNGTGAGTFELTGISGAYSYGVLDVEHPDLTVFNGEVLFAGADTAGNSGLWVTNGTAAGTHEITGISGAFTGGIISGGDVSPSFTVFNGEVLFNGEDAAGQGSLWVTNGTAAGTHELTGISGAYSGGLFPSDLTVFNGEVLFNGTDTAGNTGLWVTNGTAAGTHEITSSINPSDLTPGPSPVEPVDDFNGDGVSDALWRNTSGEVDTWLMNNGQVNGGTAVGSVSSAWRFAGAGDITGNGTSDVLWQNTTTGEVDSWLINAGHLSGGSGLGSVSSAWQSLGTGDFTGDGISDLLWRNTATGEVDTWLMNNGHLSGGAAVGSVSSAWQVAGIGDFDGDGTSDVVWHNTATGAVESWLFNNGQVTGGSGVGFASSAWQSLGTGDFNGDGTSDILWRNVNTGEVDTWLINNGHMVGGAALGSVSSAWQFAGIGDYTGSGTSDVLWRNTNTGEVDTWIVSNDHLVGGSAIGTASTAWQPQVIHTA